MSLMEAGTRREYRTEAIKQIPLNFLFFKCWMMGVGVEQLFVRYLLTVMFGLVQCLIKENDYDLSKIIKRREKRAISVDSNRYAPPQH